MKVSSQFDGGNIEVVDITRPDDAHLRIRHDSNSEFLQWFNFRVSDALGVALDLHIDNAGETTYPPGWQDYRAVATYDRQHFFRVPTDYDGKRLTIRHTPRQDVVYYSYFAPYSHERHQDLIARCLAAPGVRHELLGHTLEGRDMDLLRVGELGDGRRVCWIVARQHPGETMAEWLMEGLIARLVDPEDPIARTLRSRAVFFLVPHMNPDGSFRGNLRVNAAGANLNREWQNPTAERSPEVLLVRRRMEATGVDFCLDVHGDESLPYVFAVRAEGIPDYTERIQGLEELFVNHLADLDPDFQLEQGYELDDPGEADLRIAGNYVAQRFDCLSLTLEMPFIDNANRPDEEAGWSPERSRDFARSTMESVLACLTALR